MIQQDRIAADPIQAMRDLYEQGLYVSAYAIGQDWGPIAQWEGTDAQIMGARLASQLGAPRQADWLVRRAWRGDPQHAEATYFYGYLLWRRRGPYPAWRWTSRQGELAASASDEVRSSWYALRGELAGAFHDFDVAETWLRRASEVAETPWVNVCWSVVLEFQDRYEDALAKVREALARQPFFRAAVQSAAHLLTLLERDDEALELLSEASSRLQCAAITAQLYGLQSELKQHAAARDTLERFVELSPLIDKSFAKWLAAQRSEVAYHLGDTAAAIELAKQVDGEFYKSLVQNLENPARSTGGVVTLPVGFVRQHRMTCVPATLSALSRYWSMPADHLQVADAICYNGTSNYNERRWAATNGWTTREFSVTEESAMTLLDRGVPFTFTTVDPGNSHLQAVIGYDARRGTLLIRDPFWRSSGEALASQVLKRYEAFGPRGMAIVPETLEDKLEGLELPDAALWDRLHELDAALVEHRRQDAQQTYDQMRAEAEGHRLTIEARRRLAIYDANATEHLEAVEGLLEQFPDNPNLQLERLSCLRHQARREERLGIYRELCQKNDAHPIFWQQYAQELLVDARRHEDAQWLLRRAIRRWPGEAVNYYILANLYWDQRRFDEALELYRFAACLGDKDEQLAQSYQSAANWFKQTDAALEFLHDRFERFGRKSSHPARTLATAYLRLDRNDQALKVVEQALAWRPDDGELLLFAADMYMASSSENMPRAAALLEQAKPRSPRGQHLRTAARLANWDGRFAESLELWQQVLVTEPLALDAHQNVSQLLAETQGRAAALEHLAAAADRFPHYHPLHELWVEWLRDEPPEVREPVIRRVAAATPDDAWVRRELAFLLGNLGRLDEAWQEAEVAGRLEPANPSYFLLRAHLLRFEHKLAEAKAALRHAVELSVDNDYAIGQWIELCDNVAERREVLQFVKDQLERQVIFGDGLLAFRQYADGTLEDDEQLTLLREALQARPDLWHAWSAIVLQLRDMDRLDEAWQLAQQATQRFPLLPRLWLDRASVCRARLDAAGEQEALENAYRINPSWGTAARSLSEMHERRGRFEQARSLLEHAVARNPLDAVSQFALARNLWRLGERQAALNHVQRAVQIEPGYEQAWNALNAWADEFGEPELAVQTLRELTCSRGGEARSWLMLARVLDAPEQLDECLAAIDKAVELNPRLTDAYDLRARVLAQAGRWEEAFAACEPPVWGDQPPTDLRARAAWLTAQRGDLHGAIERMRDVVAEEPLFYGAWSQLADWYQQVQDTAGNLEAAEAMVRISPQYEVSLGYLGEARIANGDREGASEAFRRAFDLNPQYEFAGNWLFDLQVEDEDFDAATLTLNTLRQHSESPFVMARQVQLASKQDDKAAAIDALRNVCLVRSETAGTVAGCVDAMVEAGWTADVHEVLEKQLTEAGVNPEVGAVWSKLCVTRRQWPEDQKLRELAALGDVGLRAVYGYVRALREAEDQPRLLRFIQKNENWLREKTFTWGSVGYALTAFRRYAEAARWHRDWRDRDDAEPWMLVNAVEGFRDAGQNAEAVAASRHALSLPPSNGIHLHHLWLACDAALAGETESAKQHLRHVYVEPLDDDYRFLELLVAAVIEMAEASPEDRVRVFREVKLRIDKALSQYKAFRHEPARRRAYRQSVLQIANYRGGLGAKLWSWMCWLRSW